MLNKKPLLVLLLLLLASTACYSDSPLWVFGVTDTPPTATFLPTPDTASYPTKLTNADIALATEPAVRDEPFFFITGLPEDLLTAARNASGSCDWGSELEVLYIGQEWVNFNDSIYIDDIVLVTGDERTAVQDFESDTTWTVVDDGIGADNEATRLSSNINFESLRGSSSDDAEDTLDVSNSTTVLEAQFNFAATDWSGTISTTFDSPQDWAGQESLSLSLFAPPKAEDFFVQAYLIIDGTPEFAGEVALVTKQWTEGTLDLTTFADISAVEGLQLVIGPDPTNTWYLVECSGNIGWANEDRIAGPVLFQRGQSALTRPISHTEAALTESSPFMIYAGSEPPINLVVPPPAVQCRVNEVIEITDVSSIDQDLWYSVRCSGGIGWVRGFRLFGPLPLPSQNGRGIIRAGFDDVELTENRGESSTDNPVVGTCAANQPIVTVGFDIVVAEGTDDVQPFYLIECGGVTGWVEQTPLLEVPHSPDTLVMVIGDLRIEIDEIVAETSEGDGTTEAEGDGGEDAEAETSEFLPVAMASEAAIADSSNTVGECPSGSPVIVEDVANLQDLPTIVYQITCNDATGWVEARYLPNKVAFAPETEIFFIEITTDIDDTQTGYQIVEAPRFAANPIGACKVFETEQPARITAVEFEQKALKRLGYRLHYEITCLNEDNEEIVGWRALEEDLSRFTLRNPIELLGN